MQMGLFLYYPSLLLSRRQKDGSSKNIHAAYQVHNSQLSNGMYMKDAFEKLHKQTSRDKSLLNDARNTYIKDLVETLEQPILKAMLYSNPTVRDDFLDPQNTIPIPFEAAWFLFDFYKLKLKSKQYSMMGVFSSV